MNVPEPQSSGYECEQSSCMDDDESDAAAYSCSHCNAKFTLKDNLTRHLRKESCVFNYVCDHCGQGFRKQQPLKVHMYEHTGILPFSCSSCEKKFLLPSKLKAHEKVHSVLKCDVAPCSGREFSNWSQLRKHVAQAHPPEVACPECDKKFKHPYELKKHRRVHEKDVPCGVADCSALVPRWRLKRHINDAHPQQNTKEQLLAMFTCDVCGKSFDRKGKLERHAKVHDSKPSTSTAGSEKAFTCSVEGCGKAFAKQYKLANHMHVHDKKKPFKCPEGRICGHRRYCSRQSLKVHLLEHHGIDAKVMDVCKAFGGGTTEPSDSELSTCGASAMDLGQQSHGVVLSNEVEVA